MYICYLRTDEFVSLVTHTPHVPTSIIDTSILEKNPCRFPKSLNLLQRTHFLFPFRSRILFASLLTDIRITSKMRNNR